MSDAILMVLRSFWDASVKRISPGALGMQLRGAPLDPRDAQTIAGLLPGARWEPNLVDGWIVLTVRP